MRKRLLTAIAGGLGFMGLLATPALAAPQTGDEALIPPGTTGSITVHKYEQPPSYKDDNYGMELPASTVDGLTPLAGAEFQIKRVIVADLATNAGWQEAQKAVDAFDPFNPITSLQKVGFGLTEPKKEVTNASGLAQFAKLPVGLYLVEETKTPATATENMAITPAMPFLITVPLTHPDDLHKWVYDVHAYPKNVVSTVEKTVVDAPAYSLGDLIDWPVSSTIPGGKVTTKFEFKDTFSNNLKYDSIKSVTIDGKATTDFKVAVSGQTVTVSLGDTARQAAFTALQANSDAKVVVTYTTEVIAAGEIENDAKVTFGREGEPDTEVPSDTAETKFGGINILKHDREGKNLAGAVFQVRAAHVNDFSQAEIIKVNGVDSWTTDANGKAAVDGLRYSGFADGEAVSEASGKYNFYWLVEIKAPAGYELLANPIPFTIDSQVAQAITVDVVNTPHNAGGELPKTGAAGITGLIILGVAAIGGSGALAYGMKRRKGAENA